MLVHNPGNVKWGPRNAWDPSNYALQLFQLIKKMGEIENAKMNVSTPSEPTAFTTQKNKTLDALLRPRQNIQSSKVI